MLRKLSISFVILITLIGISANTDLIKHEQFSFNTQDQPNSTEFLKTKFNSSFDVLKFPKQVPEENFPFEFSENEENINDVDHKNTQYIFGIVKDKLLINLSKSSITQFQQLLSNKTCIDFFVLYHAWKSYLA